MSASPCPGSPSDSLVHRNDGVQDERSEAPSSTKQSTDGPGQGQFREPTRVNRVSAHNWRPGQVGPQHPEVHQAAGLITAQLGVSMEVALVRLWAYA